MKITGIPGIFSIFMFLGSFLVFESIFVLSASGFVLNGQPFVVGGLGNDNKVWTINKKIIIGIIRGGIKTKK